MELLKCQLFQMPEAVRHRLERCLLNDSDHIVPGSRGEHVQKIQIALNRLSKGPGRENFNLKETGFYGHDTTAAVLVYKQRRNIVNPAYQTKADSIVGKLTIRSLDNEMEILENESPAQADQFVSTTLAGAPHDHSKCPLGGSSPGPDGRQQHFGTPVNPQGFGRKINLGGEGETKYLGFEDFLPNPFPLGPPRPLTSSLPDHCASDICLRDSPILKDGSKEKGKNEILRLAKPACRLTFCGDLVQFRGVLLSMGTVIHHIVMADPRFSGSDKEVLVIVIR